MGMRRDFVDIDLLPDQKRLEFLQKCYEYYNDSDGLMLIFSNLIEQQLYEMAIYKGDSDDDKVQKIAITTIGTLKDYLQTKAILYLAETKPAEEFDKYKVT
jgi:predicted flavoprotein YhiN